ncbi:solute carrier organic anion transporter family member 4A1-like [Xenia sp. Carnegie-2017]|uniref:solute carrier organic anion transporter family member 4A1-like n=1 Tax=Xenia sp. Carnegie-2017 TaxID=2897299 RepID=UPI001F03D8C5|nr:solute carrier organic anion transporter family member 4A1-like [Xenia sp. Carnegie-2017]
MGMFVFGQILIGAGLAPLYSLAPSYIDENTRPKSMPFAMTLWYVLLALGPLSGLSGGGIFQAYIYIDIKQPKLIYPMDNKDPRWLGAWWLGYLVSGLLTMWFAVIVAGFPPYLPGSRNTRDEHILKGNIQAKDDKITMSPVGLLYSTITLFKNKTFLFNTLANLCIVFFMYAIGPFMVQVVILKYGADPLSIAMPVTFASFFGIIAGVVGGGLLTYRISLKKLVKGAAFLCLILQTVAILAPLLFVIPGCNESNIAGVTKEYPAIGGRAMPMMGEKGSSEITSVCNAQCNCSTFFSQPVCGSNNVAYFDPCHAGCKVRIDDTDDYTNCTCVPPGPGQKYGTAKKGFCDRGCASWKLFVFLLFVAVALFTANIVPSKVVILRCVKDNQRSYGLAVQQFLFILFGFIPTHLVKYIIDRDCHIWQTDSCGRKGICWDYHTNSMSKSMTIFGLVISALATVFFFLSWYLHNERRKKPDDVSDENTTAM